MEVKSDKIRKLNSNSGNIIKAGQVTISLSSVVKELVENAIDAKASSIDVLIDGTDKVSVRDDGTGINPSDYEKFGALNCPSKVRDDKSGFSTLGFRGVAIYSIYLNSESVEVTTRISGQRTANRFSIKCPGTPFNLHEVAADIGTMIEVKGIFFNLPFRKQHAEKTIKTSFKHINELLHRYAIVNPRIRFSCNMMSKRLRKAISWVKPSVETTIDAIREIFGYNVSSQLRKIEISSELNLNRTIGLVAIVPKDNCNRDAVFRIVNDRNFSYINNRPVFISETKTIRNDLMKKFGIEKGFPMIYANFSFPIDSYDKTKKSVALFHHPEWVDELLKSLSTRLGAMKPDRDVEYSSANESIIDDIANPKVGSNSWSRGLVHQSPVECFVPVPLLNHAIEVSEVSSEPKLGTKKSKPNHPSLFKDRNTFNFNSFQIPPSTSKHKKNSKKVEMPGQKSIDYFVTRLPRRNKLEQPKKNLEKNCVLYRINMSDLPSQHNVWIKKAMYRDMSRDKIKYQMDFESRDGQLAGLVRDTQAIIIKKEGKCLGYLKYKAFFREKIIRELIMNHHPPLEMLKVPVELSLNDLGVDLWNFVWDKHVLNEIKTETFLANGFKLIFRRIPARDGTDEELRSLVLCSVSKMHLHCPKQALMTFLSDFYTLGDDKDRGKFRCESIRKHLESIASREVDKMTNALHNLSRNGISDVIDYVNDH